MVRIDSGAPPGVGVYGVPQRPWPSFWWKYTRRLPFECSRRTAGRARRSRDRPCAGPKRSSTRRRKRSCRLPRSRCRRARRRPRRSSSGYQLSQSRPRRSTMSIRKILVVDLHAIRVVVVGASAGRRRSAALTSTCTSAISWSPAPFHFSVELSTAVKYSARAAVPSSPRVEPHVCPARRVAAEALLRVHAELGARIGREELDRAAEIARGRGVERARALRQHRAARRAPWESRG